MLTDKSGKILDIWKCGEPEWAATQTVSTLFYQALPS